MRSLQFIAYRKKHSTIRITAIFQWFDFLSFIAIHLTGQKVCLFEINQMDQGRVKYVAGIVHNISEISNYENTFVRFLHFIGQRPHEFW